MVCEKTDFHETSGGTEQIVFLEVLVVSLWFFGFISLAKCGSENVEGKCQGVVAGTWRSKIGFTNFVSNETSRCSKYVKSKLSFTNEKSRGICLRRF